MSVDLKRVRETHDDYSSPNKKRAIVGSGGQSPGRAGVKDEEGGIEDWMRVVETHRKEAIYRQMQEYRRSYHDEARKVRELEEQQRRLEASVQAVEVCWTQLVTAVQDMMGKSEAELSLQALQPVLEPNSSRPALEEALQARLPVTKSLIGRFVESTKSGGGLGPTEELYSRCSKLQAESSALKHENSSLRSEISTLTESREFLQSELARSRKHRDKERMEYDKAKAEWMASSTSEKDRDGASTPGGKGQPNGPSSGNATPNGNMEHDVKPKLEEKAQMLGDTSELEALADSRLKELQSLRAQHTKLLIDHDRYKQLAYNPSEETLRSAPFFQVYLHQLSAHHARANSFQQKFEASENKLDQIRQANYDFRETLQSETKAESDQLRAQLNKLNLDLARVRGVRDEMQADLTERKLREDNRVKYLEELEGLAKFREDRLNSVGSENRRLKGMLGAESGSKGYLEFLRKEGWDKDYIKTLEERCRESEEKLQASSSQEDADLRTELDRAQKALITYERVLGPNAEAADDVKQLATRLQEMETDKKQLEMKLSEYEASTNALYTEVENLAKMTDPLQKQLASRTFDLRDVHMRMDRLSTEKAKADNKYFQAMRSKEAVEAECKAVQRSVEKQVKLLERAGEVERGLRDQLVAHEKGFIALKSEATTCQTSLATMSSEKSQLELRLQQAQASNAEAQNIMQQRVAEASADKDLRVKLQEEVEKSTNTMKRLKEKHDHLLANSGGDVSANEVQMKGERDKLLKLLRCSCCEQNFKQQVITKCFHTFCKQCLEDRIASRQRKCPACGLSFAKEDVQTIYWQ